MKGATEVPKKLNAGKEKPKAPKPMLTRMSEVVAQVVAWLWFPYLPLGKLSFLEGDPGLGKTFIALAIAAAITRGWPLLGQDGAPGDDLEPGNVIYMSAEDGLEDTLRPRLDAAGADVSRIHALTGWRNEGEDEEFAFTLAHADVLEAAVVEVKPKLIVIDPLQAYLGAGVDMHRANETRPILTKLAKIAEKHGCAVLIIRHFNKGATKAIYAGAGSIDFTAAARSVLQVGEHEGERLLVHAKSSLAPVGKAIRYGFNEGSLEWLGVTDDVTADDMRALPVARRESDEGDREGALERAEDFLSCFLADGPQPARKAEEAAKRDGYSSKTLQRAKRALGVVSLRESKEGGERGVGAWSWSLPLTAPSLYTPRHDHLGHVETNHVLEGAVQDSLTRSSESVDHVEGSREARQNVQGVQDGHSIPLEDYESLRTMLDAGAFAGKSGTLGGIYISNLEPALRRALSSAEAGDSVASAKLSAFVEAS